MCWAYRIQATLSWISCRLVWLHSNTLIYIYVCTLCEDGMGLGVSVQSHFCWCFSRYSWCCWCPLSLSLSFIFSQIQCWERVFFSKKKKNSVRRSKMTRILRYCNFVVAATMNRRPTSSSSSPFACIPFCSGAEQFLLIHSPERIDNNVLAVFFNNINTLLLP